MAAMTSFRQKASISPPRVTSLVRRMTHNRAFFIYNTISNSLRKMQRATSTVVKIELFTKNKQWREFMQQPCVVGILLLLSSGGAHQETNLFFL